MIVEKRVEEGVLYVIKGIGINSHGGTIDGNLEKSYRASAPLVRYYFKVSLISIELMKQD